MGSRDLWEAWAHPNPHRGTCLASGSLPYRFASIWTRMCSRKHKTFRALSKSSSRRERNSAESNDNFALKESSHCSDKERKNWPKLLSNRHTFVKLYNNNNSNKVLFSIWRLIWQLSKPIAFRWAFTKKRLTFKEWLWVCFFLFHSVISFINYYPAKSSFLY